MQPEPEAPLIVKGFKSEGVLLDKGYRIPMKTRGGGECTLCTCGVDEIVTDINCSLDLEAATTLLQRNGRTSREWPARWTCCSDLTT